MAGSDRRPRVLVIYKMTTFQRYQATRSARLRELIATGDPAVAKMRSAHDAHLASLEHAKDVMKELGVRATFRHRYEAKDDDWDLVVALGGDGTLLWASHYVGPETPMMSVNSAPGASVGWFSACDAAHMKETLSAALEGGLERTRLTRMRVDVDDETISTRVLNDILFGHECPAATSRYIMTLGDVTEEHASSGIWAGPPAGSTAAIRSAGGKILPIGSRRIQFVVREPYCGPETTLALTKGLVAPGEKLEIRSKMREGKVWVDGAHRMHHVDIGAVLTLTASEEPLTLLGLRSRG